MADDPVSDAVPPADTTPIAAASDDSTPPSAPTPVNLSGLTPQLAQDAGIIPDKVAVPELGGQGRQTPVAVTDPTKMIDETRQMIAVILLSTLLVLVAAEGLFALGVSVGCALVPGSCTSTTASLKPLTDTIQPIFTAMIGLVGSVVGFYFGSNSQKQG